MCRVLIHCLETSFTVIDEDTELVSPALYRPGLGKTRTAISGNLTWAQCN